MEPPVDLDELMERIRATVRAQHLAERKPERQRRPVQTPIPGSLSTVAMPFPMPDAAQERAALELALVEATMLLPRAEKKTAVSSSVPKMLRPLYRNQGGFNGIVLQMLESLLEANQQLRKQTLRFEERLDRFEVAMKQQHDWILVAARTHDENREWMKAMESYLLELGGSPEEVEDRLRRMKAKAAQGGTSD